MNTYTTRRRLWRWPAVLFFNALDIAAVNGLVIWLLRKPAWEATKKNMRRRLYLRELTQQSIGSPVCRSSSHRAPRLDEEDRKQREKETPPQPTQWSSSRCGSESRWEKGMSPLHPNAPSQNIVHCVWPACVPRPCKVIVHKLYLTSNNYYCNMIYISRP